MTVFDYIMSGLAVVNLLLYWATYLAGREHTAQTRVDVNNMAGLVSAARIVADRALDIANRHTNELTRQGHQLNDLQKVEANKTRDTIKAATAEPTKVKDWNGYPSRGNPVSIAYNPSLSAQIVNLFAASTARITTLEVARGIVRRDGTRGANLSSVKTELNRQARLGLLECHGTGKRRSYSAAQTFTPMVKLA